MKSALFTCISIIALLLCGVGCNSNDTSSKSLSTDSKGQESRPNHELSGSLHNQSLESQFKDFRPSVKYFSIEDSISKLPSDKFRYSIRLINEFANSSNLTCAGQEFARTSHKLTWREADLRYQQFVEKNKYHKWLFIFKQLASVYILIDLGLLNDNTIQAKEKINFFHNEYVQNRGEYDYRLSYYCLSQTKSYLSAAEIKKHTNCMQVFYIENTNKKSFDALNDMELSVKNKIINHQLNQDHFYNKILKEM